jgi:uncharacterized protein YndB with AHSA1/START domain
MPDLADHPDNVLRFDRRFDGPPPLVFALWTRPELVSVWFAASHGFRAEVLEMDPRPGGRWRLVTRKPGVTDRPGGVYHEVIPDRRLVYSYGFEGTAFRSTVSVDLAPEGTATRMRFCQTGFPDVAARDEHAAGWPVVWKLFGEVLLKAHGVGSWLPPLPPAPLDGVARDLEAARARHEHEEAPQ